MRLVDDSGPQPVQVPAEVDSPHGDPTGKAVLLTHGAGGSLATPGLKALGAAICSHGHLAARFDMTYRALGRRSPPKAERATSGFAAVFASARRTLGEDLAWAAGGRSYGGRVASLAVAEGMAASGLLLYSYPLHRAGDPSRPRVDHFERLEVPCLFLQGTHDPFCDLATLERHLPSIPGGATLEVVPGGDHGLKVAGARAPDGKPRSEQAVIESLSESISLWLDECG